jgi:dsDNA-specific endonuclease/ATPase MutS2
MIDGERVPLKQMDELLADITHRDHLIAELKAQINDAGDTDIDWYRQELSKTTVVLKDLRKQIAELEERLSACHEGAQVRAEVAVAKERQRILNELSQMKIDPALLIDIQVKVHYPTQGEVES